MMKVLAISLFSIGLILLSIGAYQWMHTQSAQKDSLTEAHVLLAKSKDLPEQTIDLPSKTRAARPEQMENVFSPNTGDTVGILYIPRLDAELPIVEGTDEDELAKGVGHYKGTAYPLENDQIVLSGHRDTVFRHLGELEFGDILTILLPYGEFSYAITDTKIVDSDDPTVIVPTAPKEVLTLTTCYPFSYIGNAPERYIITALPIKPDK